MPPFWGGGGGSIAAHMSVHVGIYVWGEKEGQYDNECLKD